ncbi:hypothetical protein [Halorubrum sp. DTA46]|uniref:hypothetical protein n=1 Tax=Halorubrum sp. DTA46 TaxID=3402162 RepID=UPI003AAAE073
MESEDPVEPHEQHFFPISYYLHRAGNKPPQSVEAFIQQNYRLITVSGVFAAIIVYLSNLTETTGRPIIFGMVGASILFGITAIIITDNAVVEFTKSFRQDDKLSAFSYFSIALALFLISYALASALSYRQAIAIEAIDLFVGQILFLGFILLMRHNIGSDSKEDVDHKYEIELGNYTHWLVRKSLQIAGVLSIILLLSDIILFDGIMFNLIGIDSNSTALAVLIPILLISLITFLIISISIISHRVYLSASKLKG